MLTCRWLCCGTEDLGPRWRTQPKVQSPGNSVQDCFRGLETVYGCSHSAGGRPSSRKARPEDFIVLDVTMPRMNGIEACRLIQQRTPGLEVLFVTQHDSPQMMREALAAGARGYVVKSNLAPDLLEDLQ